MHRGEHDAFFGGLVRREFLDDAPTLRDQDAIEQVQHLRQIRRDDDHRQTAFREPMDEFVDFGDSTYVDAPEFGSSKMISFGFCTSDLAITTFC